MLPTYAEATSHDIWHLLAPYISSGDLCSAALVCSRWHEIFAPHLWGNPASHFGLENDAVYVALTKFKRTLPFARFYVRQLTHTLHLPPAHAEIYQGPHADWLLTVLKRLPNLQCLVVDQLPFFDHAALLYLRRAVTTAGGSSIVPAEFSVRLLNASSCANATHLGIAEALKHLTGLMYLDLSSTPNARHPSVLCSFQNLPSLQVLKLKSVGLTDQDVETIGQSTGLHLRSLDVRHNALTDTSVHLLLSHCFKFAAPGRAGVGLPPREIGWDAPRFHGQDMFNSYQGVDLNSIIRNRLLSGLPQDLSVEDSARTGLTHLFISGNKLTATAVCDLLKTSTIQVLDVGEVFTESRERSTQGEHSQGPTADLLAHDKFMSLMRDCCGGTMNYLRINHSVVTGDINWNSHKPSMPELQGDLGHHAPVHASELDSVSRAAPNELPGSDPSHCRLNQDSESNSHQEMQNQENIVELPGDIPDPTFTRAIHRLELNGNTTEKNVEIPNLVIDQPSSSPGRAGSSLSGSRPRSYSAARERREHFVKGQISTAPFLSPNILPKLRVLSLVGVPEMARTPETADRLINLVKCCASLVALAKEEARNAYHQPPGRSRRSYEREYVRSVVALEKIVIEIAEPDVDVGHKAPWRKRTGKSSTQDQDTEAFWAAAENDFTFFDEDECGLPVEKQQSQFYMDHKMSMTEEEEAQRLQAAQARRESTSTEHPSFDVVGRLAAFRTNRKQAYDRAVASGLYDPNVEGYWEGQIHIIRPHLEADRIMPRDCYGNQFEKGYLYR